MIGWTQTHKSPIGGIWCLEPSELQPMTTYISFQLHEVGINLYIFLLNMNSTFQEKVHLYVGQQVLANLLKSCNFTTMNLMRGA